MSLLRRVWPIGQRAPRVSGVAASGLWPWLAACLLAWLTAHALANTARLIWPGVATLPASQIPIDPGTLPVVPSVWGGSSSPPDRAIPMTDLPYTVVGQAISGVASTSLVVLATPSGQQTLMAGDQIEPAIAIERIDSEGVILSRHGQLERLPWPIQHISEDPIHRIIATPTRVEMTPATSQDSPL